MRLISIDKKTKAKTWELTRHESEASDRFDVLLNEGHSCASAADIIRKEFQTRVSDSFISWLMY